MQYNMEAIMYMSKRIDAELVTGIIISHINNLGYNYEDLTITDATAGIGGNTFSFAEFFKNVNAVEIDSKVFGMLKNNITKCKYNNVNLINTDYIDIMYNLKQNIVFLDPPWGGRGYKKFDKILLKLSMIDIEDICYNLLLHSDMMAQLPMLSEVPKPGTPFLVVLKLPLNYNFTKLYLKMCHHNIKIFTHQLKKMFVVVIYKLQ